MNIKNLYIAALTCIAGIMTVMGCSSPAKVPDLGGIYNDLAQHEDPYRNPVILIPGLLGSKLVDADSDTIVSLKVLVDGFKPAVLLPRYPAAVLGTLPAVYMLLPRNRHSPLLDADNQLVEDIYDPALWIQQRWGLADLTQDRVLQMLLPDSTDDRQRRQIAIDHLKKCLERARQFSEAMDRPVRFPTGLRYYLVAGDSEDTAKTARIQSDGTLKIVANGPGDGTVLRSSALLDERLSDTRTLRLVSPIPWSDVMFLFSSHRNITNDPAFTDNLLYILLEKPRDPKL